MKTKQSDDEMMRFAPVPCSTFSLGSLVGPYLWSRTFDNVRRLSIMPLHRDSPCCISEYDIVSDSDVVADLLWS